MLTFRFWSTQLQQLLFAITLLFLGNLTIWGNDHPFPLITVPGTSETLDIAMVFPVPHTEAMCGQSVNYTLGDSPQNYIATWFSTPAEDGTVAGNQMVLVAECSAVPDSRTLKITGNAPPKNITQQFVFKDIGKNIIGLFDQENEPVYHYVYDLITNESVPKKEIRRRTRGCYMHPLFGINGEVLTDDFPIDHYHHHGIFWAWPHVKIGTAEHDFWNETTDLEQRFVKWLTKETSTEGAVLAVENGWFIGDKKVMIERVWFRSFKKHDGTRSLDVQLFFVPIDEPVVLRGAEEKSYGGFAIRFKPEIKPDHNPAWISTTKITVPSGVAKGDLPETPLEWADFTSRFGGRETASGAAIFIPPTHPDFPPTWLTRYYGALCVGWPGVHDRVFEPQKPFSIMYRVWVHDTEISHDRLIKVYDAYKNLYQSKPSSD